MLAPPPGTRHNGHAALRLAGPGVEKMVSERVLVFGDDAKAFLGVVRSLGRRGIEVHAAPGDFSAAALKSRFIAAVHRLPSYWLGGESWAEAVAELADRERIGLIVPTSDGGLLMLMRHADRLGRDRLALPSADAAAIFTDKAETRRLAFAQGVPVCPGRLIAAGDEAGALARAFGLPLVLKPRRSWDPMDLEGKRPARIVRSRGALAEALGSGLADQWVVESFFAGVGVGLSVIARQGELLAAIQHRRLHEESETGPSSRRVTEALSPRLLAWTRTLAGAAGLSGVAMFEFRRNPATDEHVLLEVNPRFWGSLPLALAAGADFPAMLHDLHRGRPVGSQPDYAVGLVRSDLLGEYSRLVGRIEQASGAAPRLAAAVAAAGGLARLLRPTEFDSWADDDPEPFFEERRTVMARLRSAAARRLESPGPWRSLRVRRHLRRALHSVGTGPLRLLVVDDANLSRGPFAEHLLRDRVAAGHGAVEIASAGTLPVEDRAPSAEATAAAARFGVDISRHRSRSLTSGALLAASAVIVFDHVTADRLRGIEPGHAPVVRLPDLTDARDIVDVAGPGLIGEFRRISESVSALAGELVQSFPAL